MKALAALVAVLAAVGAAGCGEDSSSAGGSGGGTAVVRPVVIEGVQQFPLTVLQEQGIAKKHNLDIQPIKVAGPEAAYTRFQAPQFQLGLGSWAKAAQMRAAGEKLINVFPVYGYSNDVLVPKSSSIRSLADLKGKKVGLFGGPGSGTTVMLRLIASRLYGFDPQKDSEVIFGAAALLNGQLGKGDLDAALLLDPLITNRLLSGEVRSIGNLAKLWKDETGEKPLLVTITMNEEWANANQDVAKRFVAAFAEAQQYIKTHPEVWKRLAASVGIKTPEGVELLRNRTSSALVSTWNDQVIQEQLDFAKSLTDTFGKTKDFPATIPDGTFTTRFAPSPAS